ncbi:CBS domain-containing protein [Paucibacter oligotrophus]|uniref:CBS domain-containing protein n=2 Tax=Roseateles oligotrophus TaxID=1769250 RepID=A0ABT2YFU4_9BURK|nr:CBS domain-containing protein [Roseateles oligotrophus]
MQIQHIMSTRVVTVELDDRLEVIKKIFDASKFHHVLVVEESRLFGVVSDRDLFKALSPYIDSTTETARDVATLNKRVHQVMSRKPITLRPEAPISEAIELFLDHQISCLPVVDKDFKPVGILSWRDILKWIKATQMPPATSA